MKVISLYLNTQSPTTSKYAPTDKTNLANVKWSINWREIFGKYAETNKACRVKAKIVSSPSVNLNSSSNQGNIRVNFTSQYSNLTNGLNLGVPIVRTTGDTLPQTFFSATISSSVTPTILTVNSGTTPNVSLPIGTTISGNGIPANTTILSQISQYSYSMSNSATASSSTVILNTKPTYYLDLDTIQTFGSNINIPMSNDLYVQFFKNDDTTFQSNVVDYQLWLYFDIEEDDEP